jgi:hypothetical protein
MTDTKSPWEIAGANRARRRALMQQIVDRLGSARSEAALLYKQLPYIEDLLFGYESEPSDATSSIALSQESSFDEIVQRLHAIADENEAKAAAKQAKREAKNKAAEKPANAED